MGYFTSDINIILIIGAVSGYLLSLDLFGLIEQCWTVSEYPVRPRYINSSKNIQFRQSKAFRIITEIFTHILFLCLNIIVMIFLPVQDSIWDQETLMKNQTFVTWAGTRDPGSDENCNFKHLFDWKSNF